MAHYALQERLAVNRAASCGVCEPRSDGVVLEMPVATTPAPRRSSLPPAA